MPRCPECHHGAALAAQFVPIHFSHPDPENPASVSLLYISPALIVTRSTEFAILTPFLATPICAGVPLVCDCFVHVASDLSVMEKLGVELMSRVVPSGENAGVGGGAWTATEKMLEEVFI